MSYVVAAPEFVAAAANDLATILSNLSSANAAALAPTSGVMAAGADEISATIAALFGAHAQAYQALSAQAAMFHQQFVQLMTGGASQYGLTEAANASPLDFAQPAATSAVQAASVAGGMPAAAPPPSAAAAMGVTPAAATSVTPAALTTAAAPAAAQGATPAITGLAPLAGMSPASGTAVGAVAPAEPAAPVEAIEAEGAELGPTNAIPANALPLSTGTPLGAAPASRAYTPATPAYSPGSAAQEEAGE
ncbi:PE family protein [Mycobacterium bohemicum]|uniref:PE family protein n=1 Tax=Mycobacterium bohemicum TaxID=56425 RepID=UPI00111C46B0|nr:PE family protein [Mycobacterium bohemicum]MCV6968231.1 PE family protein [Mycobacterium bohemicum]